MSAKRRQEAIARFSIPLEDSGSVKRSTLQRASDDNDSDFVMSDDNSSSLRKKAKGKGNSTFQDFESSAENPRVMLLSLKAVRWIVNLMTGAENLYREPSG